MTDVTKNPETNPSVNPSEPAEEKTLKQLQAEVIELGMPADDVASLTTKAAVRAVINTLKASAASKVVTPVASIEEKTKLIEAFQKGRSLINEKLLILARTVPQSIWFSGLAFQQGMAQGGQLAIRKRELIFDGYVYYKDIPEEELRQMNEYIDSLKKDTEFMSGFNSIELSGVERASYGAHGFTKFHVVCTFKKASESDSNQG